MLLQTLTILENITSHNFSPQQHLHSEYLSFFSFFCFFWGVVVVWGVFCVFLGGLPILSDVPALLLPAPHSDHTTYSHTQGHAQAVTSSDSGVHRELSMSGHCQATIQKKPCTLLLGWQCCSKDACSEPTHTGHHLLRPLLRVIIVN